MNTASSKKDEVYLNLLKEARQEEEDCFEFNEIFLESYLEGINIPKKGATQDEKLEVLLDIKRLAKEATTEGRNARYYFSLRSLTEDVEWLEGWGTIDTRNICEIKQQMLAKLLLLCNDKLFFEKNFQTAWDVEYKATFWDQESLDQDTLLECQDREDFDLLAFYLSNVWKKQIRNVPFEPLFLRIVFDIIARALHSGDFKIPGVYWKKLITLALHPTEGHKVLLLFKTFNFKAILTNKDFRNGTLEALNSWVPEIVFGNQNNIVQLLVFFKIPKTSIDQLLIECVQKQQLRPIGAFLEQTDWLDKSGFSGSPKETQGSEGPSEPTPEMQQVYSRKQQMVILNNHIAFLKNNAPARETFAKTFTELFEQNQAELAESNIFDALASFEADVMKIAPFWVFPSLFQIKQDLLIKEDPALVQIAEMFLEEIYRENEFLEKFVLPQKGVRTQGDDFAILANVIKVFMFEASKVYDQKVDKLQDALAKYQMRWLFFFKKKLNKKNLVFLLALCYALIKLQFAVGISSQTPPIYSRESIVTMATSSSITENMRGGFLPVSNSATFLAKASSTTAVAKPQPADKQQVQFKTSHIKIKHNLASYTKRLNERNQPRFVLELQTAVISTPSGKLTGYLFPTNSVGSYKQLKTLQQKTAQMVKAEFGETLPKIKHNDQADHSASETYTECVNIDRENAAAHLIPDFVHQENTNDGSKRFSFLKEKKLIPELCHGAKVRVTLKQRFTHMETVSAEGIKRASKIFYDCKTGKPVFLTTQNTQGQAVKSSIQKSPQGKNIMYGKTGKPLSQEHFDQITTRQKEGTVILGEDRLLLLGSSQAKCLQANKTSYARSEEQFAAKIAAEDKNKALVLDFHRATHRIEKDCQKLTDLNCSHGEAEKYWSIVGKEVALTIQQIEAGKTHVSGDDKATQHLNLLRDQVEASFKSATNICAEAYPGFSISDTNKTLFINPPPLPDSSLAGLDKSFAESGVYEFNEHRQESLFTKKALRLETIQEKQKKSSRVVAAKDSETTLPVDTTVVSAKGAVAKQQM
jgi:hypothetical protein